MRFEKNVWLYIKEDLYDVATTGKMGQNEKSSLSIESIALCTIQLFSNYLAATYTILAFKVLNLV